MIDIGTLSAIAQIAGTATELIVRITKFINDARFVGEEIATLRSKSENLCGTFKLVEAAAKQRKELAEENPRDQHDAETLKAVQTALSKSDLTVAKLDTLIEKVEGMSMGRLKKGGQQARLKINQTKLNSIEKKIDDNNGYLRVTLHCLQM